MIMNMNAKKRVNGVWVDAPYYTYKTAVDTFTTLPAVIKTDGSPIISWSIKGNTLQNGTPTPDNPVEVQAVGDKTANLFDRNATTKGYRLGADGNLFEDGTYEASDFIKVEPNTTITRNINYNILEPICEYNEDKIFIQRITTSIRTVTLSSDTHYIRTAIRKSRSSIMLNEGETALPYEPYGYRITLTVNEV